jgi:hypothetical protein
MFPVFVSALIGALAFKHKKMASVVMTVVGIGLSFLIGIFLPTTTVQEANMPVHKVCKAGGGNNSTYYTFWQQQPDGWNTESWVYESGTPIRVNHDLTPDDASLIVSRQQFKDNYYWMFAAEWPWGYHTYGMEVSPEKLAYFTNGWTGDVQSPVAATATASAAKTNNTVNSDPR